MKLAQLIPKLFILRKSQMGFDFSAPAGNAHDHHVAYTRTNASGTVSQIQSKGTAQFHDMVQEARRWRGAAKNVDEDLAASGADNRTRLRHSRMTTKADLDSYLMRKFDIDEVTARNVSNHLTEKNISDDRSAEPHEFAGEPWADSVAKPKSEKLIQADKEYAEWQAKQTEPQWEQKGRVMSYRVDFPESSKKSHHIIASYQPKPGGWDYHYQLEERYIRDGKQKKIVHLAGKHSFESEAKNILLKEIGKKRQSIDTQKKMPSWMNNADTRR